LPNLLITIHGAKLTKLGLIENMPTTLRLYRVTKLGKMAIKNFIDNVEQGKAAITYETRLVPK